jgi:molybdopterin-dependent oxidoreductase alpha subunit
MSKEKPEQGFRHRRHLRVGLKPYGIGEQKPNHYLEMVRTVWKNRRHLPYAMRILRKGVCDGCALGVAGFRDWSIKGVHLCTTRLDLLETNTMGALDHDKLRDVEALRRLPSRDLRLLGRLAHPMVRRRAERGFTRVTWDEALDLVAGKIRATDPNRVALYLTARGLTNEVYYVAQKAMRYIGSPHIDNAARVCHAPSTAVLKRATGVGATTVSYRDVIEDTDLVVLFGSNVANAQPVFMKYLFLARKRGARVAVVNPLREPGLERYWVPSNIESAIFGTHMADEFFTVHTGGDVAFLNGVLKVMLRDGDIDRDFVRDHTKGFDELLGELERESFADLERCSGATRADMERFARMYASAVSSVLVWSMGITQHERGSDNVAAIVNLALARGNIGRPGAGLMPIRGHSGVQGGAEMGAYSNVLPGGVPVTAEASASLSAQYGFEVPAAPGMTAVQMLDAAPRGELDVLWSSGGNFLEVMPDPESVAQALGEVPMRVHQDIVLSSQMLVDPGETVVLLPAATRYEQRGGGTETTTERRIAYSPEIRGGRPGEVRSEWEIFTEVAARVDPARADLVRFPDGQAIRDEIARVVPAYEGIETLRTTGDAVQWGGRRLCEGGKFPTPDGRGHFAVVVPAEPPGGDGKLVLSTRRGKQFNTMVHRDVDPITGAARDALFMAEADVEKMGLARGERVLVRSRCGEMRAHVYVAPIRAGNVQVFFPEGNVLLPTGRRDGPSDTPDYTTTIEVIPVTEVSIGR